MRKYWRANANRKKATHEKIGKKLSGKNDESGKLIIYHVECRRIRQTVCPLKGESIGSFAL